MPNMSSVESGASHESARAPPGLVELLQVLPPQYALSTDYDDRSQHARLLLALRAEAGPGDRPQKYTVQLAWCARAAYSQFSLWLVFYDRRGSLGVITSVISDLSINIGKASVFCTHDGIAIDSFTVDRRAPPKILPRLACPRLLQPLAW